ncbi:MAG: amidase [Xenococcus sp. (in: cyanobacteria)]
MVNSSNLPFTSALELSKLIRSKEISPLELIECYGARIEQLESKLGSFAHLDLPSALQEAQEKTEILGNTKDTSELPLFFGIPTAIKDLYPVKGMPIQYGNAFIPPQIADYDSGIVSLIKQAGFIITGKTATSELGSLPYTESPNLPPCRNPWHLDYTAGGSSGGAAAAVAGGLLPIAPGSDGGGSVRGPAFCCGLVGLKPSRGRISNAPVGDYLGGIATHGCLTRTVADSAALLDVLSQYITGDPYWLTSPDSSFLSQITQTTGTLKIAFATSFSPGGQAEDILTQQVHDVVKYLEEMGHVLVEACPDFSPLVKPFTRIWQSGIAASGFPEQVLSPMNVWLKQTSPDLATYLQSVQQMQVIARQIVSFFDEFDLLVTPTYLKTTIKTRAWAHLSPEEALENIIKWINPCPPFNATGQPAIAIPTGFDTHGLPIGVQLVGKPADEVTILQIAHQLEQIIDWSRYTPQNFTF